jgi:hypothetical protein
VLDLGRLDLDAIAAALADQTDYEHRWLINPQTGEVAFWTSDTGIDGQNPVDLDELDLVCIDHCRPTSGARAASSDGLLPVVHDLDGRGPLMRVHTDDEPCHDCSSR